MYPLPENLVERLKNRQAILVAGLGCSELAGLPTWAGLCARAADRIADEAEKQAVLDLIGAGQLATAAALIRYLVHEVSLTAVLRECYPMNVQVPGALQALARAPWRGIITTALDALWTSALAGQSELSARTVFAAQATALGNGHGRFLVSRWMRVPSWGYGSSQPATPAQDSRPD